MSEAAASRIEELRVRIRDEIDAAPEELRERAEIEDGQELPPLEPGRKAGRAPETGTCEQLGGKVNLRAEEESMPEQEARAWRP